jgi:CheY-like chemotaxis protein
MREFFLSGKANTEDFDIIHLYASVAHEVNNPLTIIDGYAEIIQSLLSRPDIDRTAVEKYCVKMRATIKRVSKIVNGLKEMALSSEGEPSQNLNVTAIIQDAINLCHEKITKANVSVDSIFGQSLPVTGWSWQLVQVFCNLINNACDSIGSQANGTISIKLVPDDQNHVITVDDSGSGVPEAIRNRIFYPFYTTKAEGTGMGLALSKQFLKNHGGDIRLDGTAAHGRFVITIPKKSQRKSSPLPSNDPTDFLSPRSGTSANAAVNSITSVPATPVEKLTAKILIVDDELEIIDILKIYLTPFVDEIKTASSPSEAIKLVEQERFDIIITDIVMPEMTGFELIDAARAAGFKGQFIIITGSSSQMPEEAIAAGVDSVFNKPINFPSLTSRLRFLLAPVDFANSKRRFERMMVNNKVRIRLFFGERELVGNVGDISRGGFFFSGEPQGLKNGSEVSVRIFHLNHNINRVLDATAIVRWLTDSGAGCQFHQIDKNSHAGLDDLITYVKTNVPQT